MVGCEDGVLTVLDPGGNDKEPVLVSQQVGKPIIDIIIGDFLPTSGPIMAMLSPWGLSYFSMYYDASDLSRTKIEELFSHEMTEHAYNMCLIPSQTTQQILVQSVGCVLTLYQGEQCVFSRSPLPALHPGPLSYCYPSSSLVTSNGGRLHSVKFSLLAGLGNTAKRVTFDWSFHLGDTCIDMAIEDSHSVQPSIICLCRYAVFCFTTGGSVRWQIRLETVGTALMVYNVGKESTSIRFCVATSAHTLLVFADTKLMWNCQTEDTVISLKLSNYNSTYQYVLSMLSTEGRVFIGYLGTEPNLYKVPPLESRFVDFKAKIKEMREIEASIKDIGQAGSEKKSAFVIKCFPGELEKATVEHNVKNDAPVCPLTVSLQGVESAANVKINVRSTMQTTSRQFVIERSGDSGSVKIPFFVGDNMPVSTTVHLAAHCSETQATSFASIRLPLTAMFTEASPERNASYKLTLDSDRPCADLNTLFREFQTENPTSIGFRVHGYDATAAIFTANKSNRYRIQTDYPQLLNVVVTELVERLRDTQGNVQLHANVPMSYITIKLEELVELESKANVEEKVITNRSREIRAIEALVLNRTTNTKPQTFDNIDILYNDAHDQLFTAIDELSSIRVKIQEAQLALSSLFDLAALLLNRDGSEIALNGLFITDTPQSIEERLLWASQVSSDASHAVAILCQQQRKYLPQIKEDGDEANDPDIQHEKDIKS
ncbi:hypothetical protein KIN20_035501 [Parelaphostrongylus tenuis]|uniref:Protein PTHB1 n=1 Tax=Parelaphostrongylus tenuis TaxID=148309 RepID=A0AAD5WKK3_PARTN|nr:hypothetical protein KIN20_035501 [Parelaphostrongylus tenuis]